MPLPEPAGRNDAIFLQIAPSHSDEKGDFIWPREQIACDAMRPAEAVRSSLVSSPFFPVSSCLSSHMRSSATDPSISLKIVALLSFSLASDLGFG